MTPQEILELSEPVEQVYTDVVAQLVSNICRHLGQGKELSTQQWEIKKLSELDALTNESIKIIQNASGKSRAEIKRAIAEAMGVGVRDVERVLKGAERAGAITGIGFTAEQSDALKNLLSNLVNQAEDRANLVNTVMLNSTRNRYVWAVNNTATEEQKLIEKLLSARNADELERQLGKVQTALNVATSSVEVGAESRVQALSRTVKQLAQEGITGYIDAGGHHWSPEAYMNMDIRTTVHNAYVQAQKERAAEYNVSTFQITSHAGARPLCAPYQGKFYSWDGSDGVLEDLHGNKHVYESIHATSYGQPAGIFGINCGHDPVTFVNGYSIPRYEPTQDAEQNAKDYAESQKQRQLERNVRQAKLEAIAQDAAGNKEAFKTAAEKVRQANADYKAYCKETGRTPRNDRLQVYASPDGQGYNRSMSGKVTGTTRGWKPTTPANVASQATQNAQQRVTIKSAKDMDELVKAVADELGVKVADSVKGLNFDYVKDAMTGVKAIADDFPSVGEMLTTVETRNSGVMSCSGEKITFNEAYYKEKDKLASSIERCTKSGWWPKNTSVSSIGTHEAAHGIEWYLDQSNPAYQYPWERMEAWNKCTEAKSIVSQACKNVKKTEYGRGKKNADLIRDVSRYANENASETLAESFADWYTNKDNASPLAKEIVKLTKEKYKDYGGK